MTIPYRTRRFLHKTTIAVLIGVLIATVVWLAWLVWVNRFVVYTRDGAVLDFSSPASEISGQLAVQPTEGETVPIYYNEGSAALGGGLELAQINGYYISYLDLKGDISALRSKIYSVSDNTPIVLELKDIYGNFYYSSKISGVPIAGDADIKAIDKLISDLAKSRRYLIVSVPAFRDRNYGLNNTNYGVASSEGAYLYMDNEGCYWLDPESSGTFSYLTSIVSELKGLGFDEILFTDFCYPDTEYIAFSGDRSESIADAAAYCMKTYATDFFAISFQSDDADFVMPSGRGRLYLANVSPTQLKKASENIEVDDILVNLVFMTSLSDTRYDEFSVMRSIQIIQ